MELNANAKRVSAPHILALRSAQAVLDPVYRLTGYAAAFCMVLILAITILQMVTRYIGVSIPGIAGYAGYLMAASSFLGMSYALMHGAHIRIETVAKLIGQSRTYLDLAAFGFGALIMSWFAFYACSMVLTSYQIGEMSTDLDATALWLPQLSMGIGAATFAIGLWDNFLNLLFTGEYRIQKSTHQV